MARAFLCSTQQQKCTIATAGPSRTSRCDEVALITPPYPPSASHLVTGGGALAPGRAAGAGLLLPRVTYCEAFLCPMKKLPFYSWQTCQSQERSILLRCHLGGLRVARARVLVPHVLAKQSRTLGLPDKVAAELRTQAEAIGIVCDYK